MKATNTLNKFSFLISRDRERAGKMKYYLLGEEPLQNSAPDKRFCLIPYKNPQQTKPEAIFYEVQNEAAFEFPAGMKTETGTLKLRTSTEKATYIEKLKALKQHIQLGNIYEINYCIEFYAEDVEIDPLLVFKRLTELTHAPYAALVKLKDDYIISASPELFLRREGNFLHTKPIKGTARRGSTMAEDEEEKERLHNSLKERTENVMAVDVARNDLSVIAKKASVKVNKLYNIETYETLHQMVSTVSCELKEGTTFNHIIGATFPMASMTGAPKISAMNLIDEYEDFERNFYSGAMGLVNGNGDFELSVNIRSIFYNLKTKRLSLAVGSAITHLCDPETEYEECLLKANALLKAVGATF